VSPWYFWSDTPVEHKSSLFVKAGRIVQGPPSVKYRGLFLNDESPDLTGWVREKYGVVPAAGGAPTANYGRGFYTNLFELILRLKGNYLWPAMWNNRFNEDDPANPRLADEYGIVMGTSHQEPMLRAQKEWDWGTNYGRVFGNWNYSVPRQQPWLQQFWRDGVRRNKDLESIFTLGLRAENDSGAPIGKDLTGEIVKVQRQILAEEVNPDLTRVTGSAITWTFSTRGRRPLPSLPPPAIPGSSSAKPGARSKRTNVSGSAWIGARPPRARRPARCGWPESIPISRSKWRPSTPRK
jgi:hypothetical protein